MPNQLRLVKQILVHPYKKIIVQPLKWDEATHVLLKNDP